MSALSCRRSVRGRLRVAVAAVTGAVAVATGSVVATGVAFAAPSVLIAQDTPAPPQFPSRYTLQDLGLCTGTDCGVAASTGRGELLYMAGRGAWAVTRQGVGGTLGWSLNGVTAVPSSLQLGAGGVVTGRLGNEPDAPCVRWDEQRTPVPLLPSTAGPCRGVPSRIDAAGTVLVQRPALAGEGPRRPTGLFRVAGSDVRELTVEAPANLTVGPLLSSESGMHLAAATLSGQTSHSLVRIDPTGATTLLPCPRPADPEATTPISCTPVAISPDGAAQLVRADSGPEMGWFWAQPDGTFSMVALPLDPTMVILGVNTRGDVLTQRGEKHTIFHKVTCAYCMRSVTLDATSVADWPAAGFRAVAIDDEARVVGAASSQPGMTTIARLIPVG